MTNGTSFSAKIMNPWYIQPALNSHEAPDVRTGLLFFTDCTPPKLAMTPVLAMLTYLGGGGKGAVFSKSHCRECHPDTLIISAETNH